MLGLQQSRIRWLILIAAVLATVIWFKEYRSDWLGGSPIYRWWLAALHRYWNSVFTSIADYIGGAGVWLYFLPGSKSYQIATAYMQLPIGLKATIDELIPVDPWWNDRWHNRFANWLGHFTFSMLAALALVNIPARPTSTAQRSLVVALIVVPLAGIFIGKLLVS